MIKQLFTLALITFTLTLSFSQTKLLRFPDIHQNTVVFCYGGDLWKATTDGGVAVRLTAHPGQEIFPKVSPDGQWVAFTGQYDGDEQVYVMPIAGGVPKQLTYYPASGPLAPRWGYDHQVYGWSPDGQKVLFRSLRDANGGSTETALYLVSTEGGLPERLPMPSSGAGDLSPDGSKILYSPLFRDFRTWKRYSGGWAQDLYIFDLKSYEIQPVSHTDRTERDPMWLENMLCFASDRSGVLNLYAFDSESGETRQLTESALWDVRWPSSDEKNQIIYELNGELQVYNTESGTDRKLSITVPNDGLAMRPSRYSAEDNIEWFEVSPKGERALFVARGDVFTAPVEKGSTRNLTNTSNAHERQAVWSPDGRNIAYFSDATGEEQVYMVSQDGLSDPVQLTTNLNTMLWGPKWSPDSKRIAFSDKDGKLYVLTLADRSIIEVADDEYGGISDYSWSPHGGHLAYSLQDWNGYNSLYIWSVNSNESRRITTEYFHEYGPSWDPEGKFLYYLADRSFAPIISSWEWNFAGDRETMIYAMALRKDVEHPFMPEEQEVTIEEESKKEDDGKKSEEDKEKEDKPYIKIDFDGLADRALRVPIEADNIGRIVGTKGHIVYTTHGAGYYGRSSYTDSKLHIYSFEDRKSSELASSVGGFEVSADGKKIILAEKGKHKLYDAKMDAKDPKSIATNGLMLDRVPMEEWMTIFDEVWRRYRDYFYVENMHGYDWKAIGDRYRALVPYVANRSDLNYIIGEMIAELSVGHAYIQGGDFEIPDRPKVALPGARFEVEQKSGKYRIERIFQGQNEEPRYRAPLTEVGVDARKGDYVLAVDGEELKGTDNIYRLLQHKTNPVTLTLNTSPSMEGARQVTFNPIDDEGSLLYLEWVNGNRKWVSDNSGGKVGYIHIPDMGASGIYEFIKWYYPQIRKQGMVVDVRSNGGGNVSQWIIERLDSKLLGTRFGRNSEKPLTYPYSVFHGHLVCLLNETSASDGDIFPHRFRDAGLGPLIGKRSWGGVVGISGTGPLLDGGVVYVPLQGTNDPEGNWIIEGVGVEPDIVVENDPKSVMMGKDPQLERGLKEVMEQMERDPRVLPKKPADPVKTE